MFNQLCTVCFKMFDRLRFKNPDFMTKIKTINGHLVEQSLGISTDDYDWLIQNVNFVFHCAATVKFNEPLYTATKINIEGTENDVLALAAKMNYLKVCKRNIEKNIFNNYQIFNFTLFSLIYSITITCIHSIV